MLKKLSELRLNTYDYCHLLLTSQIFLNVLNVFKHPYVKFFLCLFHICSFLKTPDCWFQFKLTWRLSHTILSLVHKDNIIFGVYFLSTDAWASCVLSFAWHEPLTKKSDQNIAQQYTPLQLPIVFWKLFFVNQTQHSNIRKKTLPKCKVKNQVFITSLIECWQITPSH